MSTSFPVVKCSIETLDRTLYAAREVGDLVDSGDYILNTALYYGLEIKLSENSKILPKLGGHSTSQWNARPHLYAVKNWNAKDKDYPYKGKNLPQFGRERVIDQQNLFTSFIFPYEITAD